MPEYRIQLLCDNYEIYAMAHQVLQAIIRREGGCVLSTGGAYEHPEQAILEDEIKTLEALCKIKRPRMKGGRIETSSSTSESEGKEG